MDSRRAVAIALMSSLIGINVPVRATAAPSGVAVRELLETFRRAKTDIIVELDTGTPLRGSIGRTNKTRFCLMDGPPRGRMVRYSEIRTIIDLATNETITVRTSQAPVGQKIGYRPSLKVVLWIGVAIAALYILVYTTVPST
jgi:hypothetical protein